MKGYVRCLLLLGLLPQLQGWVQVSKECAKGCEERGNCNRELGICECPYGWGGPTCRDPILGGCRTSLKDDAIVALVGPVVPKSCECFKQIRKSFCSTIGHHGQICDHYTMKFWASIKCYVRPKLKPEEQVTDFPSEDEKDVQWFRGGNGPDGLSEIKENPRWKFQERDLIPLDKCPKRCNEAGYCLKGGGKPEPHCYCQKGYKGADCSEVDYTWSCFSKCSGRGKCISGFCHCEKGWWGMDCSRSTAWGPDPKVPKEVADKAYNRTHIRIYKHELPWNISADYTMDENTMSFDRLYGAFEHFEEQLASDWAVRTENPYEANLFYLPANTFLYSQNIGDPTPHLLRVLTYIRDAYPHFWARNKGKDHAVWVPGDLGGCWLPGWRLIQNPIKITHFGLQVHKANYTTMPHFWYVAKMGSYAHEYSCFKVEKDVCAPPHLGMDAQSGVVQREAEKTWERALDPKSTDRDHLLFFGGGVRLGMKEYSGGARQAFHNVFVENKTKDHKNYSDIKFGGPNDHDPARSTFCMIPYGDGWGSRIMFAAPQACIPVITQDYVHQPFDDVIPYEKFSVRLRHMDIAEMMEVLRSFTREQIMQYRKEYYKYYKAFLWHTETGGTAYNWTIRSLHKKLYNLWGHHYRLQ